MKQTTIDEENSEEYKADMVQFEKKCQDFYKYGKQFIFNGGKGKTLYSHILQFYYPQIARRT